MPRRIFLPRRLDLPGLRELLNASDFAQDPGLDGVLIDNDVHEWIEPIGLAAVCAGVRHLRSHTEPQCPASSRGQIASHTCSGWISCAELVSMPRKPSGELTARAASSS